MSVSTPILTLSCWAFAVPQAKMTARTAWLIIRFIIASSLFFFGQVCSLDTKIVVKLVDVCIEFVIGELINNPSVFHDVIPVGNGRSETEILLDQQNGKALLLERADGLADLLNNNRCKPFRRFVQQQ